MSEVRLPREIYHGSYAGIWANDLDTEPVQVAGVVDYDGPDHRGDEVFGEGARLFREELVKRWNGYTALREALSEAAYTAHVSGLLQDHHDPAAASWEMADFDKCTYVDCVEARELLTGSAPLGSSHLGSEGRSDPEAGH